MSVCSTAATPGPDPTLSFVMLVNVDMSSATVTDRAIARIHSFAILSITDDYCNFIVIVPHIIVSE